MNKETKAQAIYADMIRQAGDAVEGLREIINATTDDVMGFTIIGCTDWEGKFNQAIKTLETLTAFIQGIQATQGLMQSQARVSQKVWDKITNCTCYMNSFGTICLWCQEQQKGMKEEYNKCSCHITDNGVFNVCDYCMKDGKVRHPGPREAFEKMYGPEIPMHGCNCELCTKKRILDKEEIQGDEKPVRQQGSKEVYEKMYGPKLSPYHSISGCNCSACAAKRNIEEAQGKKKYKYQREWKKQHVCQCGIYKHASQEYCDFCQALVVGMQTKRQAILEEMQGEEELDNDPFIGMPQEEEGHKEVVDAIRLRQEVDGVETTILPNTSEILEEVEGCRKEHN